MQTIQSPRAGREPGGQTADERVMTSWSADGAGASPQVAVIHQVRPWLEAIAQISVAVNETAPLTDVLDTIASTICRLLGYDFGAVLLVDDAHERLLIRGSYGLSASYVASINSEKPIRVGHGLYGEGPSSRAFRSRRPITVRDYQTDETVGAWAGVAVEQGFRSLISVPLIVSGQAIGTFNCYTRAIHVFSDDEILLLATIANQAAIAIEAARLRQHERATIARLEEARRSLEQQAAILERADEIHTQLTGTVLDGAGLQGIASAMSSILGGAVVIDDPFGRVLAEAGPDGPAPRLPSGVNEDAGLVQHIADVLARRQPALLTREDHAALPDRAFLAPVSIGSELVARLWVIGVQGPLSGLERRALEHGATVAALEFLKLRVATEVESRLRGELLDDLLAGRSTDDEAMRVRSCALGHDLQASHVALVFALDEAATAEPRSPEALTSRLHQLRALVNAAAGRVGADILAGERSGSVIALVAEHPKRGRDVAARFADSVRRDVPRYLGGQTASVAIGPWAERAEGLPRSYRIARGALELAQRDSADRTVSLEDLGVYGLLLSVRDLDELVAFADRTLTPLREYDERKGSDLLITLRRYLDHACRAAATADALVVHPNTVAYRIRRIEQLLDADLTRPEVQLRLQLAFVVADISDGAGADTAAVEATASAR
jgi:DNA-binding PucR family transcriptional regulator